MAQTGKRAISQFEGTILKPCVISAFPDFARDPASGRPLHRQVYHFLHRAILAGHLPAGSALPSTRWLASRWRLSRNTILTAYADLAAAGLVAGRTGSGTRVRGSRAIPRLPDPRFLLRQSHYPAGALAFRDPEGNPLYLHR